MNKDALNVSMSLTVTAGHLAPTHSNKMNDILIIN